MLDYSIIRYGNKNNTFLPELDSKVYKEYDNALSYLGGKYKSRKLGHVFPYDPKPLIQAYAELGITPDRQENQYFPTPDEVIQWMLYEADLNYSNPDEGFNYAKLENQDILEPSCGQGAIVKALSFLDFTKNRIDVCESDVVNRHIIKGIPNINIVGDDFLAYHPEKRYDIILMNPPFNVKGVNNTYIKHILHAHSLLKPHGRLVTVAPLSWQYRNDMSEFYHFVADHCLSYVKWDKNTFEHTAIETCTLSISKEDFASKPVDNVPSRRLWLMLVYYNLTKKQADLLEKGKFERLINLTLETCKKNEDFVYLKDDERAWFMEFLKEYFEESYNN